MDKDKELTAMNEIAHALSGFENEEQVVVDRILNWCVARFGNTSIDVLAYDKREGKKDRRPAGKDDFEDLADLFHACSPTTAPERALVAGYWVTVGENQSEFTAQTVNSKLKDLGYGVGHITDALSALQKRKPSLVMQTAKKGTSRQARKRYKLTTAGREEVQRMARDRQSGGDEQRG